MHVYGVLVNLWTGALDRRVATKFLLKCKSSFTLNVYDFHFVRQKWEGTHTCLWKACASATSSEWSLG